MHGIVLGLKHALKYNDDDGDNAVDDKNGNRGNDKHEKFIISHYAEVNSFAHLCKN